MFRKHLEKWGNNRPAGPKRLFMINNKRTDPALDENFVLLAAKDANQLYQLWNSSSINKNAEFDKFYRQIFEKVIADFRENNDLLNFKVTKEVNKEDIAKEIVGSYIAYLVSKVSNDVIIDKYSKNPEKIQAVVGSFSNDVNTAEGAYSYNNALNNMAPSILYIEDAQIYLQSLKERAKNTNNVSNRIALLDEIFKAFTITENNLDENFSKNRLKNIFGGLKDLYKSILKDLAKDSPTPAELETIRVKLIKNGEHSPLIDFKRDNKPGLFNTTTSRKEVIDLLKIIEKKVELESRPQPSIK